MIPILRMMQVSMYSRVREIPNIDKRIAPNMAVNDESNSADQPCTADLHLVLVEI